MSWLADMNIFALERSPARGDRRAQHTHVQNKHNVRLTSLLPIFLIFLQGVPASRLRAAWVGILAVSGKFGVSGNFHPLRNARGDWRMPVLFFSFFKEFFSFL